MLLETPVRFPGALPSLEALQQRVSERTGLAIELQRGTHGNAELFHSEFPSACDLLVGPDRISLLHGPSMSYLEYATLASLVDLGGEYTGEKLPKFVNTKWHDRKWWQFFPRA